MTTEEKRKKLIHLKKKMEEDTKLPLRKGATNLVFGNGDPGAKIMMIGEGPGYWEDQKGIPFVGNAGKFLDQLLHLIKLDRTKVFVTNVINFRPPENRDPTEDEMAAFAPYLDKMIEIIKPKIIVTLGRFSMGKFIPGVLISHVHGKPRKTIFKDLEIVIIPMYHPAAGLRNGEVKRRTSEDFLVIPEVLEKIDVPKIKQTSML